MAAAAEQALEAALCWHVSKSHCVGAGLVSCLWGSFWIFLKVKQPKANPSTYSKPTSDLCFLHPQRLRHEPQKAKITRKLMQQVKRKLNASCQKGFQDPAWEFPLAWPPGWVECSEQRILLTACQRPVSSWLKLWAPKVQENQESSEGGGESLWTAGLCAM